MDIFEMVDVFSAMLIMALAGLVVWLIRQFTPDKLEGTKIWRVMIRLLPIVIGGGLAAIPDLYPVEDSMAKSILVGIIAGSFSTSAYELLREVMGEKIKALMGSKARRKQEIDEVEV